MRGPEEGRKIRSEDETGTPEGREKKKKVWKLYPFLKEIFIFVDVELGEGERKRLTHGARGKRNGVLSISTRLLVSGDLRRLRRIEKKNRK